MTEPVVNSQVEAADLLKDQLPPTSLTDEGQGQAPVVQEDPPVVVPQDDYRVKLEEAEKRIHDTQQMMHRSTQENAQLRAQVANINQLVSNNIPKEPEVSFDEDAFYKDPAGTISKIAEDRANKAVQDALRVQNQQREQERYIEDTMISKYEDYSQLKPAMTRIIRDMPEYERGMYLNGGYPAMESLYYKAKVQMTPKASVSQDVLHVNGKMPSDKGSVIPPDVQALADKYGPKVVPPGLLKQTIKKLNAQQGGR